MISLPAGGREILSVQGRKNQGEGKEGLYEIQPGANLFPARPAEQILLHERILNANRILNQPKDEQPNFSAESRYYQIARGCDSQRCKFFVAWRRWSGWSDPPRCRPGVTRGMPYVGRL